MLCYPFLTGKEKNILQRRLLPNADVWSDSGGTTR